jgi:Fas apoptotic inhibitory molecule (FAIM1)
MPKKSWTIQLEDGNHLIDLDKRWASGKRVIRVDDRIVFESKLAWMNTGNDDEFRVGLHECVLHSRTNGFTASYDLSVDGRSVHTGQPMTKLQSMPKWVWIFIVACMVIPVVTLGGALPVLLGLGGAWGCVVISRHPTRSTRAKAAWAAGITVVAWALLIAFVATVTVGRTLLTLGQPNWQEYQSQAGRYSILMPGKPKEQTQSVDSAVGVLDMHSASFEDRSGAYLAMYVDYPADQIRSGQATDILDGAAQGAVAKVKGKLARQQNFSLGAIPGREIEFDAPAQGTQPAMHVKVHYFLVNNRLYQVMVVAQQNQDLPADAQKFFDSFKLIEN